MGGVRRPGAGAGGRRRDREAGRGHPNALSGAPGPVLAVDPGDARIGLAVSDPLRVVARPLGVVPARIRGGAAVEVARRAREAGATTVVVGLPLLASGEEGDRAASSRAFGRRLARVLPDVPIEYWDERYSSVEARRRLSDRGADARTRREQVDAIAAALILQSYLDART